MTSPRTLGRLRCASARRDEAGVVVPSRIMLLAIVVVLVAGAMYLTTSPKGDANAPVADKSTTSTKQPAPSTAPTPSASPVASPSTAPSVSAQPTEQPSATPSAPAVKRGQTYVEVFNNTPAKGLAGRTAQKAEGVGWNVVGSDNWYGTIPTTTVYYPKRLAPAARMLARDLGIRRVKPTIAPMRGDRLTVILTSDYAS